MHGFYILLASMAIIGITLGYLMGFIRTVLFLIKISTAIVFAYFFHPFIAGVITSNIETIAEWAGAIAFVAAFVFCYITIHLLLSNVKKYIVTANKNILNKIGGAINGLTAGAVSVLIFIQFTDVITVPQEVQDQINNYGIADAIKQPAEFVNETVVSIFEKQPVQVMAIDTDSAIAETGISLLYTTSEFEVRKELETQMLQLINEERRQYGVHTLSTDIKLTAAARLHSADMFTRGYFSHNTPENINPFERLHKAGVKYKYAGENLAMAPTLLKAHDGLMKSPGHRANILSPSYSKVGIGILDGGVHGLMITQEFRD